MEVPDSKTKASLTELVSRAEREEEVILTRHGHAVVRPVPVPGRRALINDIRALAWTKARPGSNAARSQDDLYGDDGLPA